MDHVVFEKNGILTILESEFWFVVNFSSDEMQKFTLRTYQSKIANFGETPDSQKLIIQNYDLQENCQISIMCYVHLQYRFEDFTFSIEMVCSKLIANVYLNMFAIFPF